jgi:serine/threonine-protein kinase RsbW/sigma-B regulation protein RsbU (phosphoserine phosphatase)
MKMTIVPRADDVTHVVLEGRFDTTGAQEISESFQQATAARERPAMIDLSQVDFLASRGIGVLIASGNRLRKSGHKLVLIGPQPLVDAALRTMRVDLVTPIAADVDEALRILQGGHVASSVPAAPVTAAEEPQAPRISDQPAPAVVVEGQLTLAIKNEIAELKDVSAALAEFLAAHKVPHRAAYAVHLAIDELVANVIHYAYVDDDVHIIDVALTIQPDQAILNIEDDGRPFDPRTGPALDLDAEERRVGGLGLLMVLDMVDALKYQRVDERNRVEVRVRLVAEDQQGEAPDAMIGAPGD